MKRVFIRVLMWGGVELRYFGFLRGEVGDGRKIVSTTQSETKFEKEKTMKELISQGDETKEQKCIENFRNLIK